MLRRSTVLLTLTMSSEIRIKTLGHEDIKAFSDLHLKYFPERTVARLEWQLFDKDLPAETVSVGAFYRDRLIATQVFIPVRARYRQKEIMACKSELSLVDEEFRKRRIFKKIYERGVEILEKRGFDCVFGFTQATEVFKSLGFTILGPRYIELLLFNPLKFAWLKYTRDRFWLDSGVSTEEVPTIPEYEDCEFSLIRDESYMRHWYINNPWRNIVHHDRNNGVIYTSGYKQPLVCISEHTGIEKMKQSVKTSLKGNRMKWVALCRKTNRKALNWSIVPGAIRAEKQSGTPIFMWLGEGKEHRVPQMITEDGYGEGTG